MRQRDFDFDDFLGQMRKMKSMGPMKDLMKSIPGMSAQMDGVDFDEGELVRFEAIALSMTPKERRHVEMIDASRLRRIAEGSGTRPQAVSDLTRSFCLVRDMFRHMGAAHTRL